MTQHKKGKQALEGEGWDHAEINRRNGLRVTAQECPPGLRWWSSASDHVLGDRLRNSPQSDVELMTQKEVLNFKPAPLLEQIGYKRRKQMDDRNGYAPPQRHALHGADGFSLPSSANKSRRRQNQCATSDQTSKTQGKYQSRDEAARKCKYA